MKRRAGLASDTDALQLAATPHARRLRSTRRRAESFDSISMERTQPHETEANFSIDEYGAKTAETEECEEQLLAEYGTLLGFYLASAAVLTGIAVQQDRLPRRFGLLGLAVLGIATHKLSRIVAKDRITGILRAPFVSYIRSSGAGEMEEEPRGRGFQRGIGHLVSCP